LSGSWSDPPPGAQIGAYHIERLLGRGGLGSVYLAHDAGGERTALKLVDLGGEDAAVLRELFVREVAVARRLRHPGIVGIRDSGQTGDLAFIAMEFVAGGDLGQRRPAQPVPLRSVVQIATDLAEALAHAHAHRVLHRDIKPANVLIEAATGRAKLGDFGLARLSDLQRSRTGILAGTPAYMSPEQLAEGAQDVRSDLYSLGVLVFELLTGRLPHDADSLGALLRAVGQSPAPPVERWRPDAPPRLARLVAQLLQKDRRQRPADAGAVVGELAAVRAAMPSDRAPGPAPDVPA
jgi:serine/threonine-protein kinase